MKIIKQTETNFRPEDEKSHRFIPFIIDGDYKKLYITYSYSPKELNDKEKAYELIRENLLRDAGDDAGEYEDYEKFMPLKNLVTLSLVSPSSYRGAAHRQPNEQYHEIGEDFASPGFIKGEIEKGQWCLSLDAHAVVTDTVRCKIKIEAEGDEK